MKFTISLNQLSRISNFLVKNEVGITAGILSLFSIISFIVFYNNGLGLSYNDARSHLDIARRVVEGLKPGIAQLGSVWLPLNHVLMIPTIWNDFMWHSGLSGAVVSMISYVITGIIIYYFLKEFNVSIVGRLTGVLVYALNTNILYLQSTAMTELLLLATMTAGVYELAKWYKSHDFLRLIRASFWIMLSTLVRYDGWFLLFVVFCLLFIEFMRMDKKNLSTIAGKSLFFVTLGGFGVFAWLLWNLLIFKDPLYFIFGPYSAYAQQELLLSAGNLPTKGNFLLSFQYYFDAMVYNANAFIVILGFIGAVIFLLDKRIKSNSKMILVALFSPLLFNVLALYFGHSVLYIAGISGNTWFNVRYGLMMIPSFAILVGYLVHSLKPIQPILIGLVMLVTFFMLFNGDVVTLDDARIGASQKNVTQVSGWLRENTSNKPGFILVSAASHDAVIFSSGLPMAKFIHEGTGKYWDQATAHPSRWARWIVIRSGDNTDYLDKRINNNPEFINDYQLIGRYPFADIYQLKSKYISGLETQPIYPNQI